jgi:hypothetical protein
MVEISHFYYLAVPSCHQCGGLGWLTGRNSRKSLCQCVTRAIFRSIWTRIQATEENVRVSTVNLQKVGQEGTFPTPHTNYVVFGLLDVEYEADFESLARRSLRQGDFYVFKYRFLKKKDWKFCCKKLKMSRGDFFHAVYRIEHKLGLAALTLLPYPLFPIGDYFDQRPERPNRVEAAEKLNKKMNKLSKCEEK